MTRAIKPLIEVTQQAIHVLSREIGVVDTVRFLNQFVTGFGDYTQERGALVDALALDDILSEVRSTRTPRLNG